MYTIIIKNDGIYEEISFNDKANAYFIFSQLQKVALQQVEEINRLSLEEDGILMAWIDFK